MPLDLSQVLVIGISSRALFDLEEENKIFEDHGLEAFLAFQRDHEKDLLKPGTGFHLVKALLKLNTPNHHKVEVILMSRNHPDVYLRVSNSIKHYGLNVTRSILTGGEPLQNYLKAFKTDLFLSAKEEDVVSALRHGIAAGRIFIPPQDVPTDPAQIRIAFDGDCVLFSDEAEFINRNNGLAAFHEHEQDRATIPLPDGPFAKLLRTIVTMQGDDPVTPPFRVGLVTARNAPSHERALRTLRAWKVRVDSAAFMGGIPKERWLGAFKPHIFFDDQELICAPASQVVPTAFVPFPVPEVLIACGPSAADESPKNRFLLICKGYLKGKDAEKAPIVDSWYVNNLADCDWETTEAFLDELSESIKGTPQGFERPAKGEKQSQTVKFIAFLDRLLKKHRHH
ncbi:MAG: 5'-nucleotidase [Bryobacteraceae bacterium]|nr:5'-nucleotidase [Bryobacteraceae bacterium]